MAGNIFYFLILGTIGASMWIGTQSLILGVLAMDYGIATFWSKIPAIAVPYLAIVNVFAFALTYLWNPFSPHKVN